MNALELQRRELGATERNERRRDCSPSVDGWRRLRHHLRTSSSPRCKHRCTHKPEQSRLSRGPPTDGELTVQREALHPRGRGEACEDP